MIKNLIFDFGDIFINLDKEAVFKEMAKFGFTTYTPELQSLANNYEQGLISTNDFMLALIKMFPSATEKQIVDAWNSILLDFPMYRLEFLEELAANKEYRLFLLSNTNEMHISYVIKTFGESNFTRFKNCFEQFYLSHEVKLRKPNTNIYEFVLSENNLKAKETFFVDDTKENTDAAALIGIKCWNLIVGSDDIIHLNKQL